MAQLGGAAHQEHDYIGTLQATITADQHATIAYLLNSAFWGYGYAQEACRCLLTLLFNGYHCQEVQAEVDTRNHASWALLERLGFRRIAVHHTADHFKGEAATNTCMRSPKRTGKQGMPAGTAT